MTTKRIVLAGGSGFLGQGLAGTFRQRGYEVVVLTRLPSKRDTRVNELYWDGKTLGDWATHIESAQAVVNLAGRTVNCRYHARNRREILDSRLDSTKVLGEAIAKCGHPPRVWLNSSTATIYKHSFDRAMDEATGEIAATPEAKDAFSVEVALAWTMPARPPHARSPCARPWSWGRPGTACYQYYGAWCAWDSAGTWRLAANTFPGFMRRIFAPLSIGSSNATISAGA